ncbi:MAG: hypothetical protein HC767_10995 [Akkermansiaceae bacterium]|nr:hypothetical protein [Akkermansiaceae bacterium]
MDAKIQGPYDGHNMADYETDTFTRKLFITGGVGITAVLPMLKRMILHIEKSGKIAAGMRQTLIRIPWDLRFTQLCAFTAAALPPTRILDHAQM